MKKLIAIVAMMLLTPFSAFALTAMPDSQMNNITGQAGVSIAAEVDLGLHVGTIAWGDADGVGAFTTGGWAGISDLNAELSYGSRANNETDIAAYDTYVAAQATADVSAATAAGLAGAAAQAAWTAEIDPSVANIDAAVAAAAAAQTAAIAAGTDAAIAAAALDLTPNFAAADLEFLTIDVATDTVGIYNGAAFVRIGLGTFELSGHMDLDIRLGAFGTSGHELKTLDIIGMQILGGAGSYVDITTAGRLSGVTLGLNVLIDEINIESMAWGDSDGVNHTDGYASFYGAGLFTIDGDEVMLSSAGYSGLANVAITDIAVTGSTSIDVATLNAGNVANILAMTPADNADEVLIKLAQYMDNNVGETSETMVFLAFGDADGTADAAAGDMNIHIGSLTAISAVGSTTDLRNGDVMGSLTVSNADVTVDGIVAITAH